MRVGFTVAMFIHRPLAYIGRYIPGEYALTPCAGAWTKLPANRERLFNAAVGVIALRNILFFKGFCKFGVFLSISESAESPKTTASSAACLPRVCCEQLVHRVGVVLAGLAFADTFVFQTRKGGEHVNRRLQAFHIQVARQNNLPSVIYPVRSGMGWVLSSSGIVKIGICVIEPFLPLIRPARSYKDARSV